MDHLPHQLSWQLSQASVRGKSHVDTNLPNQDSVFVRVSDSGAVVCAAVSDGAGTATRSGEGSSIAAEFIATRMCQIGLQLTDRPNSINKVREEFEITINLARHRIDPTGAHLRDFHCTMVAWLCTPVGAFIAQIGDSVALSTRFAAVDEDGMRKVDFFPDGGCHLHEVDRGEYANETHFITEADWKQHLRISQLPEDVDAVVLMTDGAMDIAMLRGQVFRGFLSNLLGKLITTPSSQDRHDTIHAWLDDRQTYGVTGDDKTIFVGVRTQQASLSGAPVYLGPPRSMARPEMPPTQIIKTNSAAPVVPSRSPARATPVGMSSTTTPVQGGQPLPRVTLPSNLPGASVNKRLLGALVLTLLALIFALAGLCYVLFFGADSDSPKPTPQVVAKERDNTPKHQPSIPAGPLPPESVIPAEPVTAPPELAPAVKTTSKVPSDKTDGSTKPRSSWIVLSPFRVVEFNKDGAVVTVSLSEGPDLIIKSIQFKKDELATKAIEDQCKKGIVLKVNGKACNLSVVATRTEVGATFQMTLKMDVAIQGGAAIDKVIFFRSNSDAPRPGSGKPLRGVSPPASTPEKDSRED